jgi:uncharacterized protein YbbC (DUF1343 family)
LIPKIARGGQRCLILLLFVLCASHEASAQRLVQTGLEVLVESKFAALKGKHVGLIANQTSRTSDGQPGPTLFAHTTECKLVALFAPEHGLFGERSAGVTSNQTGEYEGVPVYSLYGVNRKPSQAMLNNLDALVFDIQDIGVRPYTYLSTMILAMEAAALKEIPFYVLDRPNPLGGERVEGNIIEADLKSFVGQVPIPYIHGMTLGELAQMAVGEHWFVGAKKLDLTVIGMRGWKRRMNWSDTKLPWVAPSPNIPHPENAIGAALLGATGELGFLSIGIGTEKPFLRVGSTLTDARFIDSVARIVFPKEIKIAQENFTITTATTAKMYDAISLTLPADPSTIVNLYQRQFKLLRELLKDSLLLSAFRRIPSSNLVMFEKVTGTHSLLEHLKSGKSLDALFAKWRRESSAFAAKSRKYRLYS